MCEKGEALRVWTRGSRAITWGFWSCVRRGEHMGVLVICEALTYPHMTLISHGGDMMTKHGDYSMKC